MCQAQNSLNASYFLLIHQYLVDGLLWPVWNVYTPVVPAHRPAFG